MKKFLALALVFVLALGLLAGCGEAKQEPEGGDEAVNVCVVVSSTFGDRSFNDSAKEGADKLAADYENITISTIECNNENFDAQTVSYTHLSVCTVPALAFTMTFWTKLGT